MKSTDSPLFRSQSPALRAFAERVSAPTVNMLARQPGMAAVFRVTVHYHDRRAQDSIATLKKGVGSSITLEIVYDRALNQKPLFYTLTVENYEIFIRAVLRLGFDRLTDQPHIPPHDVTDVWLVERAAGTFAHSLLVAPDLAQEGAHARLINAIRNGMPEMLHVVK
jgi:hypothetical protein